MMIRRCAAPAAPWTGLKIAAYSFAPRRLISVSDWPSVSAETGRAGRGPLARTAHRCAGDTGERPTRARAQRNHAEARVAPPRAAPLALLIEGTVVIARDAGRR